MAKSTGKESGNHSAGAKLQVVIDTPRGSRNKYKWNEETRRFTLSKVMPEGMVFPFDFGYLPGTKMEDGDPLDVLVLSDEPTFSGCEIECRPIGVLKATQAQEGKKIRNDRIVAVANASVVFAGVGRFDDLHPTLIQQIEEFFVNYQKVRGIKFEIVGREGPSSADKMIADSSVARKPVAVNQ